jgi:hypothetical protein
LMLKVAIFIRQPVRHTIGPQGGDLDRKPAGIRPAVGKDR